MAGGPALVDADDPTAADRAVEVLRSGGSVLLPTDTVYGLAALPSLSGATDRLFALKGRSTNQPVAVLVAGLDQARSLVVWPEGDAARWMTELWPGPLTVVLHRSSVARPLELGGDPTTVGVRCPDHRLVRSLAASAGPLATTSANRHGRPTPSEARAAAADLAGRVDLIVDGGSLATKASTVVDATQDPWRLLREGAITADQLECLRVHGSCFRARPER